MLPVFLPGRGHLTEGLSGYHQANIVTLESGSKVALQASATFGKPDRTDRYETYVILEWRDGANVLARLEQHQSGTLAATNTR